jgi:NAD(P)H-hydrate epimerase
MLNIFDKSELKKLYRPGWDSGGEENGQVTIIGGSSLFHGAPLLALKTASRIVDMVFFSSPEKSVGHVAEMLKSKLLSFIWVPWEDINAYIEKSDAVLIGPGLMRFGSERTPEKERRSMDQEEGELTKEITKNLLKKHPNKRWVIDAGSLQVMDAISIPQKAVLTPNLKEYEMLFKSSVEVEVEKRLEVVKRKAKEYDCTIVLKGSETIVASPDASVVVKGGNPGMTKGGTGDVLAGLTVALLSKNEPFLSAASASYIEKAAADELYKEVGVNFNAEDLVDKIPKILRMLMK